MDSNDSSDSMKSEKARAMRRYNLLRSIGHLFRLVELCLALLFLSWTFARLLFAVRISGEFLRRLAVVASSPLFVFALTNSIIAALIAKSGFFSAGKCGLAGGDDEGDADLYNALVSPSEDPAKHRPLAEGAAGGVEYQDKEVILTETEEKAVVPAAGMDYDSETVSDSEQDFRLDQPKAYRRVQSENLSRSSTAEKIEKRVLQRSKTENLGITEEAGAEHQEFYPEDKLSNEEFRQTIEAFIAKQLMFRRQESLSVVLQN